MTHENYLKVLLKQFWTIDSMIMDDSYIDSKNESRKQSLYKRYERNYHIIKNYFISCVKNNRKAVIDLYEVPHTIYRALYKYSNTDTLYEMKQALN